MTERYTSLSEGEFVTLTGSASAGLLNVREPLLTEPIADAGPAIPATVDVRSPGVRQKGLLRSIRVTPRASSQPTVTQGSEQPKFLSNVQLTDVPLNE